MFIPHNYLRMHRKRAQLKQSDLAFVMNLSSYSSICRFENGNNKPDIEILLMYHLLFDVPIESFFEPLKHELAGSIAPRIIERIQKLKAEKQNPKIANRVAFLGGAFTRLTGVDVPLV